MERATVRSTVPALERCVGEIGPFIKEYWGRSPLLRQERDTGAYQDIFSLADVDYLLTSSSLRSPGFRLVKAGNSIPINAYTQSGSVGPQRVSDVPDAGRIYEEFRNGATIVIQGIQKYWMPLALFCRDLELALTHPTQTNAYITPPNSQGLGIHYDTHDVFVLQFSGRKRWEVYECLKQYPMQTDKSPRLEKAGPVFLSTVLEPGDCLYIPRGYLHEAYALEDTSAHLTVGILAFMWRDVLQEVFNEVPNEVAFREAVPPGVIGVSADLSAGLAQRIEKLKQWLDTVDVDKIGKKFTRRFWSTRTPLLAGQLQQLEGLGKIDDRTIIRRRPGNICVLSVIEDGKKLHVMLGDRQLIMPADLEPAMQAILDSDCLTVGDLAEHMDEESRPVLVRRLIREGLVEAMTPDETTSPHASVSF